MEWETREHLTRGMAALITDPAVRSQGEPHLIGGHGSVGTTEQTIEKQMGDLAVDQCGMQRNHRDMEYDGGPNSTATREPTLSGEQMQEKSLDELKSIYQKVLCRIRAVFKDLSEALEQKDSLLWELQYRFITIEQLLKNREKLKMTQPGTVCSKTDDDTSGM
ncbi:protein EURL homolog [Ambystoma mexicanum]|uniref:protein EURL homolog n=1 Tax=Ambystoma mexicanum TaxID=8296 RepID=UPI0037E7DC89